MTTLKRISVLLALGACLAAAGCGSDDEGGKGIPAATARALEAQLQGVQDRLDNGSVGACEDILTGSRGPNRAAVQQLLDGLPNDVDPDVRDALEQSFDNLWSLIESECQNLTPDQPVQTETTTTPPETTPTETQTETVPTTPTDSTTQPTTPDQAPLAPEGNGNNDGSIPPGNGNGNGGGGIGPGAYRQNGGEGE